MYIGMIFQILCMVYSYECGPFIVIIFLLIYISYIINED